MKYKKIYEKRSYGRELIGYKCEKAFIEINTYDVTARGNFHKDYIVKELNKIGKASRFDTLKEAKESIEKYL